MKKWLIVIIAVIFILLFAIPIIPVYAYPPPPGCGVATTYKSVTDYLIKMGVSFSSSNTCTS